MRNKVQVRSLLAFSLNSRSPQPRDRRPKVKQPFAVAVRNRRAFDISTTPNSLFLKATLRHPASQNCHGRHVLLGPIGKRTSIIFFSFYSFSLSDSYTTAPSSKTSLRYGADQLMSQREQGLSTPNDKDTRLPVFRLPSRVRITIPNNPNSRPSWRRP